MPLLGPRRQPPRRGAARGDPPLSFATRTPSPFPAQPSIRPRHRITNQSEYTPLTGPNPFPFNYSYDLMGNMTYKTLGFFNPISIALNTAARPISYTTYGTEWPQPNNLVSNAHYNAAGQLTSETLGTGETETYTYDKRLRTQAMSTAYNNTPVYSFSLSFAPDSDILSANDSVNGNWNYSYDQFNRLVCANLASNGTCPTSGTPTYSYVYDRFGNRWQQNGPYSMQLTFTGNNPSSPQNNNRMDGYTYDSAGNLHNDGTHTYFYDAENRLVQVDGTLGACASGSTSGTTSCYYYDAEGHRVHRTGISEDDCLNDGNGGVADFAFDLDGHWTTRTNSTGGACSTEIYLAGRHFGTSGGNVTFDHTDWLGTSRLRNTAAYPTYNFETCTSLPFGDGLNCNSTYASDIHFTGKEHDYETGLDNFGARFDSSSFGRFMSADDADGPDSPGSPQSLNLYSYVANNPTNSIDPDGHDCVFVIGNTPGLQRGDCSNAPSVLSHKKHK